jgi:hypothetical protein
MSELYPAERCAPPEELPPAESLALVREEFHNLVAGLAPGIRDGRWSTVIVEGISAQPVGTVVGRIMSRWAAEHGSTNPAMLPVAPNIPDEYTAEAGNEGELYNYLRNHTDPATRVLILTEYVYSGRNVRAIEGALACQDVTYDIGTLVGLNDWAVDDTAGYYVGGERYFGDNPLHAHPYTRPQLREAIGMEKDGISPAPFDAVRNPDATASFLAALHDLGDELYEQVVASPTPSY